MACLAQRDPVAALDRAHHAYIHDQHYTPKPGTAEVTRVLNDVLGTLLGERGVEEILSHPWARLHIITAQGRGLADTTSRASLGAALVASAALNVVSRRALSSHFRRVVFSTPGDVSPLAGVTDLPTTHIPLTSDNLRLALQASGSIPMVIDGVPIASAPGGLHWDGGVTDYHLDLPWAAGDGVILYPHFYPHVVPGWFDKSLPWRRAGVTNFRRALLLAPSEAFVRTLPRGRIPDRGDFAAMGEAERIRTWEQVRAASAVLGEELGELLASGRIAERIEGWR